MDTRFSYIKKENLLLFSVFVTVFASMSCFNGFMVSYLRQFGYTPFDVNILNTIICVCSLALRPAVGFITQNYIPIKKYIIITLFLSACAAFLLPAVAPLGNIFLVYLAVGLMCVLSSPLPILLDAWCVKLKTGKNYIDYGKVRAGGSLGFSLCAVVAGNLVVMLNNFNILFVGTAAFSLISIIIAVFIPPLPCIKNGVKVSKGDVSYFQVSKMLMKNKAFIAFLFSSILFYISYRPLMINLPYKILELGGDSSQIGGAGAIFIVCEIPVIYFMRKISAKHKISYFYVLACFAVIIRCTTLIFAQNIFMIFFSQVFQSIANVIILSAPITYISRALPDEIRTKSTNIYVAMTQGVAAVLSTIIGAFVMQFASFTYLSSIALVLSIFSCMFVLIPIFFMRAKNPEGIF